jgi:hypothetical protein
MPGKKSSDLRPSEKELPKRRSGVFRHKNTPANTYKHVYLQHKLPSLCVTEIKEMSLPDALKICN